MDLKDVAYLEDGDLSPLDGKLKIKGNGKPVLIMISGNFCGYCKSFKPEFQKAANALREKINFCVITIDEQKKLGKELNSYIPNFRGVPMVVEFRDGKYAQTYNGERTAAGLIEFANKL